MLNFYKSFKIRNPLALFLLFTFTFSIIFLPPTLAKQSQTTVTNQIQPIGNNRNTAARELVEQGEKFYRQGNFKQAADALQEAIRIYQVRGEKLGEAAALTNLALALEQQGRLKEASESVNTSLKLLGWNESNQKLNVNNPKSELLEVLAQSLERKAGLLLKQGQAEASGQTSKQAESIWQKLGNNQEIIRSRINQAQALRVGGFYRRALSLLQEVEQQLKNEPDSVIKITALRSLGNALQQSGDLPKSLKTLQQSLEVAEKLQLTEEIALSELSLGNYYRASGDIDNAILSYKNAAEISPNSLAKLQAQINQLSLLVDSQKTSEASALIPTIKSQLANLPTSQDSIYASINFARTLTKLGDKLDSANILARSIEQSKAIEDKRAESYATGSLAEVNEQQGQWQKAINLTEQALSIVHDTEASDINYRWQWLLGRLYKSQGNVKAAIASYDSAVANLQSLRSDLVAANQQLQFNFRDSVEPIYRQSVEVLLQEKEPDLDKARKRIEALQLAELDKFFQEACLSDKFVAIDEVVDRDSSNTAIFYPIVLENQTEVILKLPKQQLIRRTSSINNKKLEGMVTELLESVYEPEVSKEKRFLELSQELYNLLIKPVQTELKNSGVNTLVFIPDSSLRSVPFAALYNGQEYLVERYAVSLSLGLQLFTPKPLVGQQLNALAAGLTKKPGLPNLPKVKEELDLMKEMGVATTVLLDEEFKKQALENKINEKPFRVVHLATHGQFSSQAEKTYIETVDGRINVSQLDSLLKSRVEQRPEPIELLVLSACETASGDNRAALGLAGVALRAGARSTVASLSAITDDSTVVFVGEFYRELLAGKSIAQSVQLAQLKLLKDPNYSRPLYWSPYVLVGNWL